METSTLTASDVMMMTKDQRKHGAATTAIGLASGLGGGALLLGIAVAWGLNQASKARYQAAENASAGNTKALELIANTLNSERTSRENWQTANQPSIQQYVDVQTNPSLSANTTASSVADALAYAQAVNNNSGLNSAVGNCGFLRVQRYSAPQPCGCDSCSGSN